jgi:predicted AlkP superfamily pyrophosphatase or phosphodiesterase
VIEPLIARANGQANDPDWFPLDLGAAEQVVLLVLDGLGWEQLNERSSLAPTLAGARGGPITSVAPSTTACALTSLSTGLAPAVHGVIGYRIAVNGSVLNVLGWRLDGRDVRQQLPPGRFQPYPPFPGRALPTPVVTRSDYQPTGFTAAHLGDARLVNWYTPSGLIVGVRELLGAGERFIYAYYDGVDRVAHAKGLGDHYDMELKTVDRLVADLTETLVPGSALVVTADHGQVDVGASIEVLGASIMDNVELLSGEGRFRWLHVREGATDDVADAARELYGTSTWVVTREQLIEERWLGGEPRPEVVDRLGDVALVPFTPTAFLDPADTGEQRLAARHGSLTSAEMLVPLLGWVGSGT